MWNPRRNVRRGVSRRRAAANPSAFTLVEVLVSMSVLVLLVVCVAQLTNGTASTVVQSRKYLDADSQARLLFSRMRQEFLTMLERTDVDLSTFKSPGNAGVSPSPSQSLALNSQGGSAPLIGPAGNTGPNDQLAFYARGPGYYNSSSTVTPPSFAVSARAPVSLIAYAIRADADRGGMTDLQRVSKALGWDPDPASNWQNVAYLPILLTTQWPNLFTSDPDSTSVGDQVFRFEYTYLLKPNLQDPSGTIYPSKLSLTPWWSTTNTMASTAAASHASINGFSDVAAIVVAIAVMDPASRVIINSNSLPGLISALPDAAEGADIKASWDAKIANPNFAGNANIPQSAAAAVRTYQRFFYLDGR